MASTTFLDLPGGVKMPALGLGTFQAKEEKLLTAALNAALEAGYRHIDTAYFYQNEAVIGKVLKQWFSSGKLKREDVFITTKLPVQGVHPDRVEIFLKKSLENLQLDYVDLYLIHFPIGVKCDLSTLEPKLDDNNRWIPETGADTVALWRKMEEQVDAGRAKTIGLSNYNKSQIQNVLSFARIKPANLQVELHVCLQQRDLVDFCQKNGVTVVAYSPLGSPGRSNIKLPDVLGNPVVARIAKKHHKTPAQVVLRFLLQRNIAVIPKSVTPKRVQENIGVFDFDLDDGDVKELSDLEVGDSSRIVWFKFCDGVERHPDYPFGA